jgi:hypothetical protein
MSWRSVSGERFREGDCVAYRRTVNPWRSVSGIAWRIVGLRIGEENTYGHGTRWNAVGTVLDWAVLEPEVGVVGTGGGWCWNRRWAVLEPEVGGVGTGYYCRENL